MGAIMNWIDGHGIEVAHSEHYRIRRLASPAYQFSAIWQTSMGTEETLGAYPTEDEAKAACEAHAEVTA